MEFDLTISLPGEARYAAIARLVASEAAREAGSTGAPAETFATRVEDTARACLAAVTSPTHVTMAVHRHAGALVVTIDSHTMRLDL